jgi:hypothetical protein
VPFKVYIYCTESKSKNLVICNVKECYYDDWGHLESFVVGKRGMQYYPEESRVNGKVIGEFICDKIEELTEEDGYPMPTHTIEKPPLNYCYVNTLKEDK